MLSLLGFLLIGCFSSLAQGEHCEYELLNCVKYHRPLSADYILLDPRFELSKECWWQGKYYSCLAHAARTCSKEKGIKFPYTAEERMKKCVLNQLCTYGTQLYKDYKVHGFYTIQPDTTHCIISKYLGPVAERMTPELRCWLSLMYRGCIMSSLEEASEERGKIYKALTGLLVSDDICGTLGVSDVSIRDLLDNYGTGRKRHQPAEEPIRHCVREDYTENFEADESHTVSRTSFRKASEDVKFTDSPISDTDLFNIFNHPTESSSDSCESIEGTTIPASTDCTAQPTRLSEEVAKEWQDYQEPKPVKFSPTRSETVNTVPSEVFSFETCDPTTVEDEQIDVDLRKLITGTAKTSAGRFLPHKETSHPESSGKSEGSESVSRKLITSVLLPEREDMSAM